MMSEPSEPSDEQPVDRRAFFRRLLYLGMDSAEQAGRSTIENVRSKLVNNTIVNRALTKPRYLRPPGALAEEDFAATCSRCGDCVKACPAGCIVIDTSAANGLPHIVARQSPCVVCTDLSCMKVCPTGALKLVDSPQEIDMGTAVMNYATCLRTPTAAAAGEDCRLCLTQCPMGETAMNIDHLGRVVVLDGCVGCGVCERVCPTQPTSVIVKPRESEPVPLRGNR